MDTASLKSFATSARTELIREVGARVTAVLTQGSPERVEQPRAVTALERAISAGGGGDKGKAVLLVSVELDEILALSDRILVIADGAIVGELDAKTADERTIGLMMANIVPEHLQAQATEEVTP